MFGGAKKTVPGGGKNFLGGGKFFWGGGGRGKYTKYNKINNNSENFKGCKIAARGAQPPLIVGLLCSSPKLPVCDCAL